MASHIALRTVLAAMICACLAPDKTAHASDKPEAAAGAADPELIADAVAEYSAGHFEEARALFRQAHERAPSARTLRGIGMASFELRDYAEASRTLSASLREQHRPLTPEQRKHAEALLERADTFIGKFTVRLPGNATLAVDGSAARLEPDGLLLLPLGHHRLVARCESCRPPSEGQAEIEVAGGEHRDLPLALTPLPAAGRVDAPPAARLVGPPGVVMLPPPEDERRASKRHLWWAGAATAAALGAGGGAFWWHDRQDELDHCRALPPGATSCSNQSTIVAQRNTAVGLTIGLGATGVVAAAVAAIWWPRPGHLAPGPVSCLGGTKGVSCAVRF